MPKSPEKQAVYFKKHYENNKEYYSSRKAARRGEITELIRKKKDVPCADCGIKYHFSAMDFDHIGAKTINPSSICTRGWGINRITKELAQCEVVCANCHRIRTFTRREIGISTLSESVSSTFES